MDRSISDKNCEKDSPFPSKKKNDCHYRVKNHLVASIAEQNSRVLDGEEGKTIDSEVLSSMLAFRVRSMYAFSC